MNHAAQEMPSRADSRSGSNSAADAAFLRMYRSLRLWLGIANISSLRMPFYAVRTGKIPGVYNLWSECQQQINGFKQPRYKKFETEDEAWDFVNDKAGTKGALPSDSATQRQHHHHSKVDLIDAPPPASMLLITPTSYGNSAYKLNTIDVSPCKDNKRLGEGYGSPTTLLSLKGLVQNMRKCMDQMRNYVTQAEDYIEGLEQGAKTASKMAEKRPASSSCDSSDKSSSDAGPSQAKKSKSSSQDDKHSENIVTSGSWIYTTGLEKERILSVYTDGCCHNNGQGEAKAGLGVYWGPDNSLNLAERVDGRQTNNRAEICAATRAIQQAKKKGTSDLLVYTDSQFVINCITKWVKKWKTNGWKLSSGGDVLNKDELEELDAAVQGINVIWKHVPGHAGVKGNEEADRLSRQGARGSLPQNK